jgi:hypothetical protein
MNALESLQQKTNGIISIKSYPILTKITTLRLIDIKLIELALSYQDDNKTLSMRYKTIGAILNTTNQNVKNIIVRLKKTGIVVTDHKSNYNGVDGGGSSTKIKIDIDKLLSLLTDEPIIVTPSIEPASIDLDTLTDDEIMALARAELKADGDKPTDIKKQMVKIVEQSPNLNSYDRRGLIDDIYLNNITTVDQLNYKINT